MLSRIVQFIIQTQAGSDEQMQYDEHLVRWEKLHSQKAEKTILLGRARGLNMVKNLLGIFF